MKRKVIILGVMLMIYSALSYLTPCHAENEILKKECEDKVQKAAELIKKIGAEAAFQKIAASDGPFVGEKSHVFCIHSKSGIVLAHKWNPAVGYNMHDYRDSDQGAPYTDILEKAKKRENGWISYMTYGSGPDKRKAPGLKNMYFYKAPGEEIVICCGYWEDS